MAVVCPNESSQEWQDLLSKTGSRYENYRLFIANDDKIPTEIVFNSESDVVNYLKNIKSLQLYNGYLYIKANKQGTTYIQDTREELAKINKLYPNAVSIEDAPINPFTERFVDTGRTTAKRVKVNEDVLKEHRIVSQIMEEVEGETTYEEFIDLYKEANITIKGGEVLPYDASSAISFYQRTESTPAEKNLAAEKTIRDLAERMRTDIFQTSELEQVSPFEKMSYEEQQTFEKRVRSIADKQGHRIGVGSYDVYRQLLSDVKTQKKAADYKRNHMFLYKIINNKSADYKGVTRISEGIIEINLAYATLDTPIHEILGHPIIRALKTKGISDTNIEYKTTPAGIRVRYKNKDGFWVNSDYYKTKKEAEGFVKTLNKGLNNQLYQNLLKELEYGKGKEVLDRIKRDYVYKDVSSREVTYAESQEEVNELIEQGYEHSGTTEDGLPEYTRIPKYTLEEQQEEAIVELLGLYTADRLDKVKDGKLISLLKRLLKEMKAYMKSLFSSKEVEIDKLPDNMTLGDIADLLAYSNSKLILPGNDVVYTTPDNQTFKTYQEASNHISELVKLGDIDLSKVNLQRKLTNINQIKETEFLGHDGFWFKKESGEWYIHYTSYSKQKVSDKDVLNAYNYKNYRLHTNDDTGEITSSGPSIEDFISKNKEYEQSKEIIEEWKKVNSIKYDPEEVYSRGQGFYSVVGAYSDFDVELIFQNLLAHIQDNKKAGGEFTISAFTKPVDRQIGHLEGGGGKIKFKIFPKPEDIKWAANTDVYSGSVWDASEKVSKDTKSELIGVSYTKAPSLRNIGSVQPNLASIIDNLAHHHNELGIELTGENFRLEYDDNVPYSTKKLLDSINSILDQKYGKLVEPEINTSRLTKKQKQLIQHLEYELEEADAFKNDSKEAKDKYDQIKKELFELKSKGAKQPTQTNENLKESINKVKYDLEGPIVTDLADLDDLREDLEDGKITQEKYDILTGKINKKEYISQAEINTKVAALKKAQRKFPRSLIRSEVRSVNNLFSQYESVFQKISEDNTTDQRKAEARRNRLDRFAKLKAKALKALERKEQRLRKIGRPGIADELAETTKRLKEMHEFQALLEFVLSASKEINSIFREYTTLEEKQKTTSKNLFPLPLLHRWFTSVLAYDILDDISSIMNEPAMRKYISERTATNESLRQVLDVIDTTINNKNTIKRQYQAKGLPVLAKFLAQHSTRIEGEFKVQFEREYNTLPKEERDKITKEEYITNKLQPLQDEISDRTELMLQSELHKASKDINYASRWIANLMDSPDPVVAAMVKAFFFQDQKARRDDLAMRDRIVEAQKELESKYGSPKEIYKLYEFMLEKDEKGNPTQHILTKYKSKLFDEYKAFYESTRELEENERRRQRRLWMSENAPLDHERFNTSKYKYYDQLFNEGKLTEEEIQNLIIADQDYVAQFSKFNKVEPRREQTSNLVNDEAAQLIDDWVFRNIWDYRNPISKWVNKDYASLEKFMQSNPNDPKTKFYNLIREIQQEADSRVPWQYRLQTRLPGIIKSSEERLASGQGVLKVAKEKARKTFNVLSDETDRGVLELTNEADREVNYIPIYFTNPIDLTDQSFDLSSIYREYYRSATEFAYKSEILPEVELTKYLLEIREVQKTKANGKPVYDPAYKDENVIRTKQGSESMIYQQFEDWVMTWVYGKSERDEGTVELFGMKIDIAKAADFLNKFTSINMLAGNVTQGTANVILGETMQRIETFAGKYINRKAYRKGRFFYDKNFPGIIGDIGSRKPQNIVSLLLERFDILNDYERSEFRKDTKFGQLMKSDTLFFTSKAGEHFVQTRFLLGMLANKTAYDADGKQLGTMLDMYEVKDGKLQLNPEVDLVKSKWTTQDQDSFLYKTRGILSLLHGEYSRMGKVALERRALGRMAFMFRKFVEPGVRRRWGNLNYNERLEDFAEGSYRTTYKFFKTLIQDMRKFQFDLLKEDWAKLTDVEKANIHRTIAETGFLISAIILSKVFLSLRADDDDDRDWIYEFSAYQMLRYRTELLFFINPAESLKILRSPAASMSMLENSIKVLNQLMTNPFEVYERGHFQGDLKLKKQLIDFVPIRKQIYKVRDIQSQLNWWVN